MFVPTTFSDQVGLLSLSGVQGTSWTSNSIDSTREREGGRERERERERDRDTETQRETHRETEREREREFTCELKRSFVDTSTVCVWGMGGGGGGRGNKIVYKASNRSKTCNECTYIMVCLP